MPPKPSYPNYSFKRESLDQKNLFFNLTLFNIMKNISFCKYRKVLWYAFLLPLYLTSPEIFAKNSSLSSIFLEQQQQIT